ncbi:hypothetical protein LR48_Vigan04g189400 [Vigna angularis]|uniref:VQ motif-containing protein n=2 Tax=Phaseolus angularis TaxID=3914 RepID=A0A0L9UG58_PHAAN|nr:uncharacterized protein LOC108331104 [Vigna angularis]KAG2399950.1 VQ motif-containing protein [Vigna angularis]KOM41696.1 hypothetical protein LR48_Vigan04g189400 [Vigna angularis]BAT78528.1 hypothetical protein VIGAN_02121600 [Vigna angularis var. angularis]
MDSGNSGSISSSDEEYDSSSHADPSFLNHFASISHPQPSLVPSHPSMFDLSSTYLHALSQSNPNQNPHNSFLNIDSLAQRSQSNCTLPETLPSSSSATPAINQCLPAPQPLSSPPQTTNLVRNSKKRSRASRRAPTTVLTTDTTNFRSMVQEFTGIPAPPFSPSFSRRLPLRSNPLLSTSSRTSLHNNATISLSPNNNSINYQLLPDLSLPYHPPQNIMQHHPIPTFHPSYSLQPLVPAGFGAKSLFMPALDAHDLVVAQGHEHVVSEGMLQRSGGDGDCRDGSIVGGGRRDSFRCLDGNNYGGCKLNISVSASSSVNHEKNLENGNSPREGAVEAWICSSDQ